MLSLPNGVVAVVESVLVNVPAPSLVSVKPLLVIGVIVFKLLVPNAPMVEFDCRMMPLEMVITPPATAAPLLTKAPALLMPEPLSSSVPKVSVPVCCQSNTPPELTLITNAAASELVPEPVIWNVLPLLTFAPIPDHPTFVPLAVTVPPLIVSNPVVPLLLVVVKDHVPRPVFVMSAD